jgi:hypothetical protein
LLFVAWFQTNPPPQKVYRVPMQFTCKKLCCLLQEQSSISGANLATQYLPVVHQSELKESDHGFVVSEAKREIILRINRAWAGGVCEM